MKICWDNLNNLTYLGNGNWKDKTHQHYTECAHCKCCNEPFLAAVKSACKFCCVSCFYKAKQNHKGVINEMSETEKEQLLLEAYEILQNSTQNNNFLYEKLCFHREDLINEIIKVFIERGYIDRYNPDICPFDAYVNTYKRLVILNLIKKCKARKRYGHKISLNYINEDKETNITYAINNETPEDIIIRKDFFSRAKDFFTERELDVLMDKITQTDLAKKEGVSKQAINKRMERKIKRFKKITMEGGSNGK